MQFFLMPGLGPSAGERRKTGRAQADGRVTPLHGTPPSRPGGQCGTRPGASLASRRAQVFVLSVCWLFQLLYFAM